MKIKTENRFKNKVFWVSVFAFIPMIVEGLTTYDVFILLPGNYEQLYMSLLSILILAGIVNNPDTKNAGFGDDE